MAAGYENNVGRGTSSPYLFFSGGPCDLWGRKRTTGRCDTTPNLLPNFTNFGQGPVHIAVALGRHNADVTNNNSATVVRQRGLQNANSCRRTSVHSKGCTKHVEPSPRSAHPAADTVPNPRPRRTSSSWRRLGTACSSRDRCASRWRSRRDRGRWCQSRWQTHSPPPQAECRGSPGWQETRHRQTSHRLG